LERQCKFSFFKLFNFHSVCPKIGVIKPQVRPARDVNIRSVVKFQPSRSKNMEGRIPAKRINSVMCCLSMRRVAVAMMGMMVVMVAWLATDMGEKEDIRSSAWVRRLTLPR